MSKKDNKNTSNKTEFYRAIADFSQIGFTIAASIFVGVLVGRFLDNVFGTSPWLLLIFSLLGAGAAIKYLFDYSKKTNDD